MARAPVHKLGQMIGDFVEKYFEFELTQICQQRQLYLDVVGKVRTARRGKKVSWNDVYGNKHDLDFVIERGGSDHSLGVPAALIECAWRRYTKHSKNKAQEIQGAVLPIAEKYKYDKPFLGAVIAGYYTEPSIRQLNSCGFETIYFGYDTIIQAFHSVGVDIHYDEATSDAAAELKVQALEQLTDIQFSHVFNQIVCLNQAQVDNFKTKLINSLDRQTAQIIVAPLYGNSMTFNTITDAVSFLNGFDPQNIPIDIAFTKVFIQIRFSNGDHISGDFTTNASATSFLTSVINN